MNPVSFSWFYLISLFLVLYPRQFSTFKLPAAQRSKRCGKVRSTDLNGPARKGCTVRFQMYFRLECIYIPCTLFPGSTFNPVPVFFFRVLSCIPFLRSFLEPVFLFLVLFCIPGPIFWIQPNSWFPFI